MLLMSECTVTRSDSGRVSGFPYVAAIICSRLFAFVCRRVSSETVKGQWSLGCLVMGDVGRGVGRATLKERVSGWWSDDWMCVRMSQWSPLSAAEQVGERSTWSMRKASGLDREEYLVMVV